MTLFFTLLPVYLLGNVHCLGMCGPLVLMIGQHRFRNLYFLGRLLSFGIAGMIAGELGAVLNVFLNYYHISAAASFLFGTIIFIIGLQSFGYIHWQILKPSSKINHFISSLLLKDTGWTTFLFGFFTVLLPCGQTLIVFSACALSGDPLVGLINGMALAALTSPALFMAMRAHVLFKKVKHYYNAALGVCSLIIGTLAICRGFAEMGFIPHFVLNPDSSPTFHIVIY